MKFDEPNHISAVFDKILEETGSLSFTAAPHANRIVKTGIPEIDEELFGLRRGSLTVLAARPLMGKSTLAVRIALNAARAYKQPTLIFSLDSCSDRLAAQFVCEEGGLASEGLQTPDDDAASRAAEAQSLVRRLPLYIDDTPALSARQIFKRVFEFYYESDEGKLGLVVIDSLQGMSPTLGPAVSEKEHARTMRVLRDIALIADVPVLLLSYLSRKIEKRKHKEPRLSDLPCASVAAYADQTWLLYRKDFYWPDTRHKGIAEIAIWNRLKYCGRIHMRARRILSHPGGILWSCR